MGLTGVVDFWSVQRCTSMLGQSGDSQAPDTWKQTFRKKRSEKTGAAAAGLNHDKRSRDFRMDAE